MEKLKPSYKEAVENGEESAIESNDFDYAQIMNVSNSTSESMPTPREIFARRNKSCPSQAHQPNLQIMKNHVTSARQKPVYQSNRALKGLNQLKRNIVEHRL